MNFICTQLHLYYSKDQFERRDSNGNKTDIPTQNGAFIGVSKFNANDYKMNTSPRDN